jgi:hypothetical protein
MKNTVFSRFLLVMFAFALVQPGFSTQGKNQRDHLTENEADLVRQWQEIEPRIEVFIKAADRRILVLTNPNATQKKKEEEIWGPLPTGSHVELMQDFKKILSEAMEKLDSAHERSASDPQVGKALDKLKKAATRQVGELKALAPGMSDKRDQTALLEAIEEAEAAAKGTLP